MDWREGRGARKWFWYPMKVREGLSEIRVQMEGDARGLSVSESQIKAGHAAHCNQGTNPAGGAGGFAVLPLGKRGRGGLSHREAAHRHLWERSIFSLGAVGFSPHLRPRGARS